MKAKGVFEMSKEIQLPIKYAVLELKEKGGYKDITRGFIVSKCYVMESNVIHNPDGSKKRIYKVAFPFNDIAYLKDSLKNGAKNIGNKNVLSYDGDNVSHSVDEVTDLFDVYETAKVTAEQKNKEYEQNLNRDEQLGILKQDFEQNLEFCYLFEQLVLEETKDMKITEHLFIDGQDSFDLETTKRYKSILEETIKKLVRSPSDFYIELAYSLSFEEKEALIQSLEIRDCGNCTNGGCTVESYEKVGLDEFGNPQGSSCLGWYNAELIGKYLIKKL